MARIPHAVRCLLDDFSDEFSPSVWRRFLEMLMAAVMVRGRRTIWRLLNWTHGSGHFSSYHRVFSHRRWSSVSLARRLAMATVKLFAPEGTLQLVGDDTVSQHRGVASRQATTEKFFARAQFRQMRAASPCGPTNVDTVGKSWLRRC